MEFKVGDKVHYNNGRFIGCGEIIKNIYNNSSLYYIRTYSEGDKYFWGSCIELIELTEKDKEDKEIERLKHMEEDPFGEEIWL